MPAPFESVSRERSPLNLATFAVSLVVIWGAVSQAVPLLAALPACACAAMLGFVLLRGRMHVFRVDDAAIRWRSGRRETAVPIADISRFEIVHWSDSTDYVIHRRDGGRIDVPAPCAPRRGAGFLAAMKARGIPVDEH